MASPLEGKVVAITGAARGIGEHLVRACLAQGMGVVALDRSWDNTAAFREELEAAGALALACDITRDADIDQALDKALAHFGRIDVLINNAAMRQRDFYPDSGACTVLGTEDAHWERMFQVNVVGTLKVIRRFIQPMLRQRSGSVINVSANGSLTHDLGGGVFAGNHPHLKNQPYDATKAAFTSLSFYLAEEVRAQNVAVNVIFPGATRTTGAEDMAGGRARLGFFAELLPPDHVVPVCLHLAAQDAASVTGKAFDVVPWNAARAQQARVAADTVS